MSSDPSHPGGGSKLPAWQVRHRGLTLPRQIGGHAAVELCNTRAGWGGPRSGQAEYLVSHAHLVAMAEASGVLPEERAVRIASSARRRSQEAEVVLHDAREVRADLYAVISGSASRAAFRRLATQVEGARSQQTLVAAEQPWARWEFVGPPSPREPLDALLVSAGELLATPTRIGRCPGRGCGWLFVDTSGRRRWCLMAACGNRAKQVAHTARRRGAERGESFG